MTAPAHRIRRGAVWSIGGTVLLRGITFATGVIIARLVAPDQVGILALVLTIQLVVVSASELGISTAVARQQNAVAAIGPTATALSIGSSLALSMLMLLLAPVMAQALSVESAASVVRIMALTVLLAGLTSVPVGLLMREFQQRRRVIAEASGLLAGMALVPFLAGGGAVGLAWSRVAGQAVSAVLLLLVAPCRWWPRLDRRVARELVSFGLPLVAATALGFATLNIDVVMLGVLAGTTTLGLYSLAFNISQWPLALVSGTINAVGLPAFAQTLDDPARLGRRVCDATQAAAGIAVPVGMLSAALSVPLVEVVYGPVWSASAPLLVALSALALVRVPLDVLGSLLLASGRSRLYLGIQALQFIISIPALFIGVTIAGPLGAALSQIAVTIAVVAPACIFVVTRSLRLRLQPLVSPLIRVAAVGLISAGAAWTLTRAIAAAPVQLVAGAMCGGVIYAVLLFMASRETTTLLLPRRSNTTLGPA